MNPDPGTLVSGAHPEVGYGRAPSRLERLLLLPALADWIIIAYFSIVVIELLRARPSATRDGYIFFIIGLTLFFAACVFVYRLRFEARATYLTTLAYHLLPVFAILTFYFNLRPILPIINGISYDDVLYRLDLRVFGVEPTMAIEPYASKRVVEWFAFFYFTYFHLIASFVFVMIVSCRDNVRLASFATGFVMIVAVGHVVYTLVPGFGPYAHLSHEYEAPLRGGVFYHLVLDTVGRAGPLRDIFPSLHTAMPVYCSLFAWRYFPKIAILTSFFSANIMVATIVLRWHYAADVAAGLVLAFTTFVLAPRLVEAYQARREAAGLHVQRW